MIKLPACLGRIRNMGKLKTYSLYAFLVFWILILAVFSAQASASVTLRVVAVNPSEDSNQTVPIKVYLPVEIKPEDVIYREDLDIAYDTQQGSYYVFGDYELKPKEVLEKEIELKDLWVIEEPQISLSSISFSRTSLGLSS